MSDTESVNSSDLPDQYNNQGDMNNPGGPVRSFHDLRTPLILAIGYLEEVKDIRQDVLDVIGNPDDSTEFRNVAAQIVQGVDADMGKCLEVIENSLGELDSMLTTLRDKIEKVQGGPQG